MNRPSFSWRKLGDSNPRYGNPYGSLANCWFQPLTQTSLRLSHRKWHLRSNAGAKVRTFFETAKYLPDIFSKIFVFRSFPALRPPVLNNPGREKGQRRLRRGAIDRNKVSASPVQTAKRVSYALRMGGEGQFGRHTP